MKPRGHYTKSSELRQYFRSMTWLGKIDMLIAGVGAYELLFTDFYFFIFQDSSSPQQLGAAVVLHMLLATTPNVEQTYFLFNRTLEALVGATNSMTYNQLGMFLFWISISLKSKYLHFFTGLLLNTVFKMKVCWYLCIGLHNNTANVGLLRAQFWSSFRITAKKDFGNWPRYRLTANTISDHTDKEN